MLRGWLGQMESPDQMVLPGHVVRKRREMMRATAEMRPIEGEIHQR